MISHESKWNSQHNWRLYLPPGRPSDKHLAIFRRALRLAPHTSGVACVLGSTPELCDLVVESGRQLVMIDHSEEFHRRTLELRIFPGSGQLVLGRWQDHLGSMRNHFDIVLSDLTSGNLTYEERPRFLKDIREALVEGGLFVDKVLTMEATPLTRRHMELTYQKRAMNLLTVNDFTNDIFFRSWLVAGLEQIHRDDILASAVSEWGTNPRLSNLLNQAAEMIPERAVWSYGRPWNQLREEYSANFATRVDWLNDVRSCPFYRSLRVLILENRSL